jgi:hypothetical protein
MRNIQPAIDAVADGGTVVVAPGIYPGPIDFRGKAVTLQSSGATIFGTAGSVVVCNSGEGPDTELIGFTITGGSAPRGAGMYIEGSSPTVIGCTFTGNVADVSGGGMFVCSEGSPVVTGCVFSGNSAAIGGGMAIWSECNPTVMSCTFSDNVAADRGGGMDNAFESSPVVADCTFGGNSASSGGGMSNWSESNPAVTGCAFFGNSVSTGGGMYNAFESSPAVTNCTFSGNVADHAGGGMANAFESSPTVTNCTFSGNVAGGTGGGMDCSFESSPIVASCIFWENPPGVGGGASGQIHTVGESAPIVSYSCLQGGWSGAGGIGNQKSDPRLADAAGPDGVPGTGDDDLRLDADSRCIDAGDNAAVPPGIDTDLDGNPRFVDAHAYPDVGNPDGVNPMVDMGAYEAAANTPASPRACIVWRHRVSGDNSLWMMNGGAMLSASGPLERVADTSWTVAGVGDFNGDGRSHDILWRHQVTGENLMWLMDGRSILSGSGPVHQLTNLDWMVGGTGDFDGDGRSDILWHNTGNGKVSLWLMDGTTILPGTGPVHQLANLDWAVAGTGDFDADGRCDILWRNAGDGRNSLWLMDGTTILPASGPVHQLTRLEWAVAGTGDFNADGRCDILWRNIDNGKNSLWLMDGTVMLPETGPLPTVGKQSWVVVGTRDFDGDGNADVLWRNTGNGKNSLWLMDGPTLRQGTGPIQPEVDTDWEIVGTGH